MNEWGESLPRCDCGHDATVFHAGREPMRAIIGGKRIPIERGWADRAWCMACAVSMGWPNFPSENVERRVGNGQT